MERIKLNVSNFKYPRIEMEKFSFTKKEEAFINNELDKLESMLPGKARSVFSISKQKDLYRGSLKIDSFDIYAHGKAMTTTVLFLNLCKKVKNKIRARNKISIDKYLKLENSEAKKIKVRVLPAENFNLKQWLSWE